MNLEFVGTKCTGLSVDPKEYTGMTVPAITEALLRTLAEIDPGVNFWPDDVVLAANEIANEAQR